MSVLSHLEYLATRNDRMCGLSDNQGSTHSEGDGSSMKHRNNFSYQTLFALIMTFSCVSIAPSFAAGSAAAPAGAPGVGGPLGLGIIIGDPTGFTGKYWVNSATAYDFGLAFNFGDYFLVYADYLYHFRGALGASTPFVAHLTPYLGFGGLIAFSTDDRYRRHRSMIFDETDGSVGIGVRVPAGLEWKPADAPIGVFLELVPGLAFVPGTGFFIEGGIGARYYF